MNPFISFSLMSPHSGSCLKYYSSTFLQVNLSYNMYLLTFLLLSFYRSKQCLLVYSFLETLQDYDYLKFPFALFGVC